MSSGHLPCSGSFSTIALMPHICTSIHSSSGIICSSLLFPSLFWEVCYEMICSIHFYSHLSSFRPGHQCESVISISPAIRTRDTGPRIHPIKVLALHVRRVLPIGHRLLYPLPVFLRRRAILVVWQDSRFSRRLWNNSGDFCHLLRESVCRP